MGILSSGSWIYSLLLLFSALPPNCSSSPSNEVVGTQCVVPGAAQLELSTEELLPCVLLYNQPQPGLPFHPARLHGWPEFNLQTTVPPGPTLASLWSGVYFPENSSVFGFSFPRCIHCLAFFQMLTKWLFPAYVPQVSKVVYILFLLPELFAILSKLESLVNSKKHQQLLPFIHPGHE